jgi:acyl-CoA reductase-like NAD-dependent aldehyde dehydrogenase
MFDLTTEELGPEETEALIEKAASAISKRKLEVPAILVLEMHKPLSFVASQATVAMSPFLIPMLGFERIQDAIHLLQRRENVERLICKLEVARG